MFEKIQIIGNIPGPTIHIIGCVHGDEPIGLRVIRKLEKVRILRGKLILIVANPNAVKKNKRYIESDLNRSFNDKAHTYEEKLAKKLSLEIKSSDLVLDIHATNSNFKELAIITNLSQGVLTNVRYMKSKRIMYAPRRIFGGNELISQVKKGIALEYGPNKSGRNYTAALRDIKNILRANKLLGGKPLAFPKKDLFTLFEAYKVPEPFTPASSLKDFSYVRKGATIGKFRNKSLKARYSFYPFFLGKGRYRNTLALVAKSRKNI